MNKVKILGLRTTIYKVGDIEKATSWYSKVFETEPYFDEPFYVGYNISGYELGLQPEDNPTTEKQKALLLIGELKTYWMLIITFSNWELRKMKNHIMQEEK